MTVSEGFALEVLRAAGIEVGRYDYAPDAPADESPKPYWHPLRALDGGLLTGYRPWDHRWHKGLSMTWTQVSGENFWGGPTYVRDEGYVWKDNVGRIRHDRFTAITAEGSDVGFTEELTWITAAGEEWLSETRTHRFPVLDADRGCWVMDFDTRLRNVRGQELRLGSPTTAGRPSAGYTGLFLRMPRAWVDGRVTAEGATGEDELMGAATPWIAYAGQHDDVDGGATVLAFAGTSSAAPPVSWFVRSGSTPMLSFSATFDEEIVLAAGAEVQLTHRLAFLDRAWDDAELATLAADLLPKGNR
jgi:hypothetical protein